MGPPHFAVTMGFRLSSSILGRGGFGVHITIYSHCTGEGLAGARYFPGIPVVTSLREILTCPSLSSRSLNHTDALGKAM